ncbi:MAG: zinc-dependent metalloprotease [Saprospiraceae bacterium]|nr:zinc-dependent metalloprotease [Saprospiraceae bacterium]
MKKFFLIFTFFAFGKLFIQAQQYNCGVSPFDAAIIKQRMLDNRQLFSKEHVANLMANRVITYIPLTIQNVQNTSGEGSTSVNTILSFLCGLNAIYADQDVQFFIHNQIIDLVSDHIDANSGTANAKTVMFQQKVANTLNIYIGRSIYYPNGSYLSYYEPTKDFVFLQQPMVSADAKTEAHEIGHFFTLPHTFYGWEGVDAEAVYGGGNAPATINSETVELVTRGAGANCTSAADGFCDTEADYNSTASISSCTFTPSVLDPTGATLDPDESNLMSYYDDNCSSVFSSEQKTAIALSIANRTFVTNTPPSTSVVTGLSSAVSPLNGALLGSISNPTVRLDWDDVPGATWYLLEVVGTSVPGIWIPNSNDVKYIGLISNGDSHFDLSTNDLTAGLHYAWRIKALNQYSTCASFSGFFDFEATTNTTDLRDLPIEKQISFKVNTNPVNTIDIPLVIYSAEEVIGSIYIYGVDGREIISFNKQIINQGENMIQIPGYNFINGAYFTVLTTDRGVLKQKFILQR